MFLRKFKEDVGNLFLRAFSVKKLSGSSLKKLNTENESLTKCNACVRVGEGGIVTAECGHSSYENYSIDYIDSNIACNGHLKCPKCVLSFLSDNSTFCSMCGKVIIPGEQVTLYHYENDLPFKSKAEKVGDSYLGCLDWECCVCGGLLAGHWMGKEKGFVYFDFEKMTHAKC